MAQDDSLKLYLLHFSDILNNSHEKMKTKSEGNLVKLCVCIQTFVYLFSSTIVKLGQVKFIYVAHLIWQV